MYVLKHSVFNFIAFLQQFFECPSHGVTQRQQRVAQKYPNIASDFRKEIPPLVQSFLLTFCHNIFEKQDQSAFFIWIWHNVASSQRYFQRMAWFLAVTHLRDVKCLLSFKVNVKLTKNIHSSYLICAPGPGYIECLINITLIRADP